MLTHGPNKSTTNNTMKRTRSLLLASIAALCGLAATAHAAVDTTMSTAVTDTGTLFTSVKTYVIGVVLFTIAISVIKMLKKK